MSCVQRPAFIQLPSIDYQWFYEQPIISKSWLNLTLGSVNADYDVKLTTWNQLALAGVLFIYLFIYLMIFFLKISARSSWLFIWAVSYIELTTRLMFDCGPLTGTVRLDFAAAVEWIHRYRNAVFLLKKIKEMQMRRLNLVVS